MTTRTTTNGIVFNDGSTQTTAAQSLGLWNSYTNLWNSSRFGATTYTNNTGRPLLVMINGDNNPYNGWADFSFNGVEIGPINGYGTIWTTTIIIPNGYTYSCSPVNMTIQGWREY